MHIAHFIILKIPEDEDPGVTVMSREIDPTVLSTDVLQQIVAKSGGNVNSRDLFVKRVAATSGDKVTVFQDGTVEVNRRTWECMAVLRKLHLFWLRSNGGEGQKVSVFNAVLIPACAIIAVTMWAKTTDTIEVKALEKPVEAAPLGEAPPSFGDPTASRAQGSVGAERCANGLTSAGVVGGGFDGGTRWLGAAPRTPREGEPRRHWARALGGVGAPLP